MTSAEATEATEATAVDAAAEAITDPTSPIPTPSVIPYLIYHDLERMRTFLVDALAFTEVKAMRDAEGALMHVELRIGDRPVMLSPGGAEQGMTSPQELPAVHAGVLVYLEDVDAHYAQARSAGVAIWYEPQDMPYGQREYGVRDPENGWWSFATLR